MSPLEITSLIRDLLMTTLVLTLPCVGASLLVGGAISLLQTVTSIQEQTLSFAPRIIAVTLVTIATLPWSLRVASTFTHRMMAQLLDAVR